MINNKKIKDVKDDIFFEMYSLRYDLEAKQCKAKDRKILLNLIKRKVKNLDYLINELHTLTKDIKI